MAIPRNRAQPAFLIGSVTASRRRGGIGRSCGLPVPADAQVGGDRVLDTNTEVFGLENRVVIPRLLCLGHHAQTANALKMFCVVREQRNRMPDGARRDPRVIWSDRTARSLARRDQATVAACNLVVIRNDNEIAQLLFQSPAFRDSPISLLSPEIHFAHRDKCDREQLALNVGQIRLARSPPLIR